MANKRKLLQKFKCPRCERVRMNETHGSVPLCTNCNVRCTFIKEPINWNQMKDQIRYAKNQPTDADLDAEALSWLEQRVY